LGRASLITIGALLGYFLLLWIFNDNNSVFSVFGKLGPKLWIILLCLSLFNYLLRWSRWHRWLRNWGYAPSTILSLTIYIAGFAFTVTPAKAGEAARAIYLRSSNDIPVSQTMSLLYFERLLDIASVAVLALSGIGLWIGSAIFAITMALIGLVAFWVLTRSIVYSTLGRLFQNRTSHLAQGVAEMLASTKSLLGTKNLAWGLSIGILAWLAEGIGLGILVQTLGGNVSWGSSVGVYAGGMLAGVASMLPGGLGGAEAFMIAGLTNAGITLQTATVATVGCRLATIWFAVLLGAFAVLSLSAYTANVLTKSKGRR